MQYTVSYLSRFTSGARKNDHQGSNSCEETIDFPCYFLCLSLGVSKDLLTFIQKYIAHLNLLPVWNHRFEWDCPYECVYFVLFQYHWLMHHILHHWDRSSDIKMIYLISVVRNNPLCSCTGFDAINYNSVFC